MLLIPCAEVDTAAAYRLMINGTAKELAIDRAKCLYREWVLLERTEEFHLLMADAKHQERKRCDFTIAALETRLFDEQQRVDRLKPWATLGKITLGAGIIFGGVAIYNSTR